MYFYEGRAGANRSLPFGRAIVLGLKEQFLVNVATLSGSSTDASFLGGTFGLAGTVPFGRASVSADLSLLGPLGTIGRSEFVTGLGELRHHRAPRLARGVPSLERERDRRHPDRRSIVPTQSAVMGLNRPGVDVKGAYTYLNTQTGTEVSGAAGFTFNFVNTATDYLTGTEFHLEGAIMQHLPSGLSFGAGAITIVRSPATAARARGSGRSRDA